MTNNMKWFIVSNLLIIPTIIILWLRDVSLWGSNGFAVFYDEITDYRDTFKND